jgi:hypothetical protein
VKIEYGQMYPSSLPLWHEVWDHLQILSDTNRILLLRVLQNTGFPFEDALIAKPKVVAAILDKAPEFWEQLFPCLREPEALGSLWPVIATRSPPPNWVTKLTRLGERGLNPFQGGTEWDNLYFGLAKQGYRAWLKACFTLVTGRFDLNEFRLNQVRSNHFELASLVMSYISSVPIS